VSDFVRDVVHVSVTALREGCWRIDPADDAEIRVLIALAVVTSSDVTTTINESLQSPRRRRALVPAA
jgi:hypothetical protein